MPRFALWPCAYPGSWHGKGHLLCRTRDEDRLSDSASKRTELENAIAALEAQRETLGDALEPAILALRDQIDSLTAEEQRTEDQRKQITVLFADVQGFTQMSSDMDPEDVADVMNSLWSRIDDVIVLRGGRIDKHIGDAVMALFGAPTAHEDEGLHFIQEDNPDSIGAGLSKWYASL